jgi:hypothetical protein
MNISLAHRDRVRWLTAAPLWTRAAGGPAAGQRLGEPAILRFRGDDFMDQAQAVLAGRPEDLGRHVARQESWRSERAGWEATRGNDPLTLYQPIHNRFYLAAATLVCQRPGLPDRALRRVAGDTVSLLMRRLVPRAGQSFDAGDPARHHEQAWIGDRQGGAWVTLDSPTLPATGEERLPMFPLPYAEADRNRRIHAAVIPVGRAAGYDTAPGEVQARASAAEAVGDPLGDPRMAELLDGPLGALGLFAGLDIPASLPNAVENDVRHQARTGLVLTLLDLGLFLQIEVPRIHTRIRGGSVAGMTTQENALWSRLTGTGFAGGHTAAQAIDRALDRASQLEDGTPSAALLSQVLGITPSAAAIAGFATALNGGAPALLDLIAPLLSDPRAARLRDVGVGSAARIAAEAWSGDSTTTAASVLREMLTLDDLISRELLELAATLPAGPAPDPADATILAAFGTAVTAGITWGDALAEARAHAPELLSGLTPRTPLTTSGAAASALAAAAASFFNGIESAIAPSLAVRPLPSAPPTEVTASDAPPDPVYVLRTLYERPACAGIHPPTVSAPSRLIRLASFYDADAPVRALSIEMPTRTSIADFRKAPRNVALQLSRELRKQISRVRSAKLSDPLEDQLGGGGSFDLGVICSLSIPIITICALILLMIVVQLLNIVFWWLPYFIQCFPVRKS